MTTNEMIERYSISLYKEQGQDKIKINGCKTQEDFNEIVRAKSEIVKELKKRIDERNAKIEAIDGLREIESARRSIDEYNYEKSKALERGTSVLPSRPEVNMNELLAKYPKAAAYLKAQSYSKAYNCGKVAAGEKALERIINGEDYTAVIAEMDAEWNKATEANTWN